MNKILRIVLTVILAIGTAYSSDYIVYYGKYEAVLNTLKTHVGILGNDIDFIVVDSETVNAFADTSSGRKTIMLMTGWTDYFVSKGVSSDDLDLITNSVMAHELAHIVLGHTKGEGSYPVGEIEADLLAIKLLVQSGYSCKGLYMWVDIFRETSDITEFTTHPPYEFRSAYNKAMCEVEMKKYEG